MATTRFVDACLSALAVVAQVPALLHLGRRLGCCTAAQQQLSPLQSVVHLCGSTFVSSGIARVTHLSSKWLAQATRMMECNTCFLTMLVHEAAELRQDTNCTSDGCWKQAVASI